METPGIAPIPPYPRLERASPDARRGSGRAFDNALREEREHRDPARPTEPNDAALGPVSADLQTAGRRGRKSPHAGEHRVDIVV